MKISALWITKDEEENIEKSIKSVSEIADELVVVDTGSTDDTVEIAKGLGATVYDFEWINDFSAARNFALDHSTGEIFIFLDADEWFEPALVKNDRNKIIGALADNRIDSLQYEFQSIDDSGRVINEVRLSRIFKRSEGLRYINKIHEKLVRPDGSELKYAIVPDMLIKHSGYAGEKQKVKAERNLRLLESITENTDELNAVEKFYIMRENFFIGKMDKAFEYFNELLHSKRKVVAFASYYKELSSSYFYIGLFLAETFRNQVSRKEIYENIVKLMKKSLPEYPESAGLLYILNFAPDERKFLEALTRYEKTESKVNHLFLRSNDYKRVMPKIYGAAASAKLIRGEKEAAMEYALKAITICEEKHKEEYIKIFIRAIKGADDASIVLLLSKLATLAGGDISDVFLSNLMYEELKTVYFYFFKKQYEAGNMLKTRLLYLNILNGDSKEAVEIALANREEMRIFDLNEIIFCAVVCEQDYDFYLQNKAYLGLYSKLAEAYFEGSTLDEPTSEDIEIYSIEYKNIVFAAGKEAGDKFLSIFADYPEFMLLIKCNYYLDGAKYREFLIEEGNVDRTLRDLDVRLAFTKCCIFAGEYERALNLLKTMYGIAQLSYDILNLVSVVAEKASGKVQEEASRYYEEYSAILDEYTDYNDMMNTGVVFDEFTKKELRALSVLTPQNFKKEMFGTPAVTSERLLGIYMLVADFYIEKGYYGMAEKYLRKLLVSGYKVSEVYGKLSVVYDKLGNKILSEELAKNA